MDSSFLNKTTGEKKIERRNPSKNNKIENKKRRSSYENHLYILILKLGNIKFGLIVDDIIDTEEIVIKALHEQIKKLTVFIGTTVLGDGRIATIVDIGNLAELAAFNINKVDTHKDKKHTKEDDKQVVLTFNICGDELYAIPLFLIGHIEKITMDQIMIANKKQYFKYQNEVIQIIHIEDALEDVNARYLDEMFVLIIKGIRPIGILVSQIIDTMIISSDIDTKTIIKPGIIGGTLINGKLTLILDVFTLIDRVEPMWAHQAIAIDKNNFKKILLLEDMKFYKSLLASYLKGTGMEVEVVSNGKEGLEQLQHNDFDIIISDLQMPIMDGFQFAQNVRSYSQYDDIKMIAISSMFEKTEGLQIVKEYGFQSYINKMDREGLLNCLNDLIK